MKMVVNMVTTTVSAIKGLYNTKALAQDPNTLLAFIYSLPHTFTGRLPLPFIVSVEDGTVLLLLKLPVLLLPPVFDTSHQQYFINEQ
jgi:hypothetical protein